MPSPASSEFWNGYLFIYFIIFLLIIGCYCSKCHIPFIYLYFFQELITFGVLTTTASLGATGTDAGNTGWNQSTPQKRGWRAFTVSCSAKTLFSGELPCSTTQCTRPAKCPSVSFSRTWANLSRTPILGGITAYGPREGGLTLHNQVSSLFVFSFFVLQRGFYNMHRAP